MIFQPVLHPALLIALAVLALGIVVLALVRSRGTGARLLWVGRALLVLLIFAALARPGIPGGTTQTLATDTDIVLMVDTTASITAEDWGDGQSRLDGVREDVAAIIAEYPGARYALITFDAEPQLRLPLTTDTSAVSSSLDVLRPEVTAQSRGSSIGVGAKLLADTLRSAAESNDQRARMVFYFGDGEQTASSDPESFSDSKKYVDGGMVFGYGTAEGGPMKITTGAVDGADSGYIQYQGTPALSVIDEDSLGKIADELGVEYQHRTADEEPTLPKSPSTSVNFSDAGVAGNVIELFWIPTLGAVLLVGVEVARATMGITRMRNLGAPRPPRAAKKSGGDA